MPIDMDNMLPGFSTQLVASREDPLKGNAGATKFLVTALFRDEEILDVGLMIVGVGDGTDYTVTFQSAGSATKTYVASKLMGGAEALGTVLRVSDGTLSWYTAADTEDERRLKKGDSMQIVIGAAGSATAEFVPFVLMRGAEPLDPIA